MRSKAAPHFPGMRHLCTLAVLSPALLPAVLHAQFPSDEEVRKQVTSKGVLEVRFPRKTRGEKIFDGATQSWYWQRGVVVVRNAKIKEFPDATVEIGGLARYFITGSKVSYQKFLVTWNEYKGIPAPDHAATVEMIRKRLRQFVGSYRFQKIVGQVHDIAVAKDHRTEWHTPHSFSINLSCRYKQIVSYTEVEEKTATFRVRFYRPGFDKPWNERIVSTLATEKRGAKTKHDADEVRAMATLGSIEAKKKALAARAAMPKIDIPKFQSDKDVFRFVYALLREGDAKKLESALTRFLAPNYYHDESAGMLNQVGARLVNNAVKRACKGKSTFAENYAAKMNVKRQQRGMIEVWNRTRQMKTRIATRQYEDPETGEMSWRLTALEPWTLSKRADVLRLRRLAK